MENIKTHIAEKDKELDNAAKNLKAYFIGLDDIIDRIISNIRVWYILPNVMRRPLIINLWGMTGVGKTDLVRRLVKELKFGDKFVELSMDRGENKDADAHDLSLEKRLQHSNIEENSSGIVLLDEIQKFKTIHPKSGDEEKSEHLGDLWNLLSDGKFGNSASRKSKIIDLALRVNWDKDYADAEKRREKAEDPDDYVPDEDDDDPKRKYKTSIWTAKEIKKVLRLKESLGEIMQWDSTKKEKIILEALEDEDICSEADYTKLLIFICGNLDDAYQMSQNTSDADMDADVLHEFSKKITVIDIKASLSRRFRAEQIARFGNVHVIYPALSRDSYEKIIIKTSMELLEDFKREVGMDITIDESVRVAIYNNGVYPSQGVRPVFTTINSLVNQVFPSFVLKCLEGKQKAINISYKDGFAFAQINGKTEKIKVHFDLDNIKKEIDINRKAMVSVHEAGHAIVYALLFKYSPSQIMSSITSWDGGYIMSHPNGASKPQMLDSIKVALSGSCAEEIVFGKENRSAGSETDIKTATNFVINMVRLECMGDNAARIDEGERNDIGLVFVSDYKPTDPIIEKQLKKSKEETLKLLGENKEYLKAVSAELLATGNIAPEKFVELSKPFVDIKVKSSGETIYTGFNEMLNKFIKSSSG